MHVSAACSPRQILDNIKNAANGDILKRTALNKEQDLRTLHDMQKLTDPTLRTDQRNKKCLK